MNDRQARRRGYLPVYDKDYLPVKVGKTAYNIARYGAREEAKAFRRNWKDVAWTTTSNTLAPGLLIPPKTRRALEAKGVALARRALRSVKK